MVTGTSEDRRYLVESKEIEGSAGGWSRVRTSVGEKRTVMDDIRLMAVPHEMRAVGEPVGT